MDSIKYSPERAGQGETRKSRPGVCPEVCRSLRRKDGGLIGPLSPTRLPGIRAAQPRSFQIGSPPAGWALWPGRGLILVLSVIE